MNEQITYDLFHQPEYIVHVKENNPESKSILELNRDHFSKQCKIVYEALLRGERLTTTSALLKYGIGDLRRRLKDLRDYHGVKIESELKDGRFKEWFITGK